VTPKPVIPRALAVQDVEQALDHLIDERAWAAAAAFIGALEQACAHIARHPATGSSRHAHELDLPGLRCWRLRRHPHLVFYLERQDHIDVWRVLHGRLDRAQWLLEVNPMPGL
jgi:toxin ParE1/3/4